MGRQGTRTASRLIRGLFALAIGLIGTPIVLVASVATSAAAIPANGIVEFPVTPVDAAPLAIVAGPDLGNMWFTQLNPYGTAAGNKIGRITKDGVITQYAIPTPSAGAYGITSDFIDSLYFVEQGGNNIGKITTSGVVTEFAIPTPNAQPIGIVSGPDGNFWFTEYNTDKIGMMTSAGVFTEYALSPGAHPTSITFGPGDALWFTEPGANKIGRITTAGVITEFDVPTASASPTAVAYNFSDGRLWFTEGIGNQIGTVTSAGVFEEFPIPTAGSFPLGISRGPDDDMWFTEQSGNNIGRITPTGTITEYPVPSASSNPYGIAGSSFTGQVWFTEWNPSAAKIGRLSLTSVIATGGTPQSAVPGTAFATPFTAHVTDINDNPLAFTDVTFEAPGSEPTGTFPSGNSNVTVQTDANGDVTAPTFTAGSANGSYTLFAEVNDGSARGTWALTNAPAPARVVAATGRQFERTTIGNELTPAITAHVRDFYTDQPIEGATVTFTAPSSGASGTFENGTTAGTGITDSSGDVTAPTYTANGTVGQYNWTLTTANQTGISHAVMFNDPVASEIPITEHALTPPSVPIGITIGPDGNTWFAETSGDAIGRLTPEGAMTEFPLAAGSEPGCITTGSDGALWFCEDAPHAIGRITTEGAVTEYPLAIGASPTAIGSGADGALWFTQQETNQIGRITTDGTITEYPLPVADSEPSTITPGPDGAMWFTELNNTAIGRIETDGTITELPLTGIHVTLGITTGADGNLWFGDLNGNTIGRMTPAGVVTQFDLPTPFAVPSSFTLAGDGNVWFTELYGGRVGRITPDGTITEFVVPPTGTATPEGPVQITSDGYTVWFTDGFKGTVDQMPIDPTLTVVGGDNQHALLGAGFADALDARLTTVDGLAMPGARVTFTAPPTGASATFDTGSAPAATIDVTTDPKGDATTLGVTAGGIAGTYAVTASAPSLLVPGSVANSSVTASAVEAPPSASFTLTNTTPDPAPDTPAGDTPAADIPAADTTGISGTLPFTGGPIAVLVQLALLLIGLGALAMRYPSLRRRQRTS